LALAIACFNFINLTIAQFSQRLRELGVRKVLGAFRRQLIAQLLLEAIMLTALASLAALFLVESSQPLFRNLTGIAVNALNAWPYLLIFAPLLSVAAGIYPALVFSALKPTAALKDSTHSLVKGAGLRKVLVVFQFSISVALIIGTLIVHEQLNFMRSKDTGFDRHQMLMVPVRGTCVEGQYEAFKNRLLQNSNVVQVSGVNGKLGQETRYTTFQVEGIAKPQILTILRVELDFAKTFGLSLVAGRNFSREIPTDAKEAFIINEAAMRQFGGATPSARTETGDGVRRAVGKHYWRGERFSFSAVAQRHRSAGHLPRQFCLRRDQSAVRARAGDARLCRGNLERI
jgi:putative ABC transport system permease protein